MFEMSSQVYVLIMMLAMSGCLVGFMAGLLGVGGGTILVPVLYELFTYFNIHEDIRMHLCIGTSFAVMIPTALQSYRKHLKTGAVDIDLLKKWLGSILMGVLIGWIIARYAPSIALRALFAFVAILLGLKMLFGKNNFHIAQVMPKRPALDFWGAGIGMLSSLLGLGGGVFATNIMSLHNVAIHRAVATSSAIGLLIAIPGMIGYMLMGHDQASLLPIASIGFVNFLAAILIIPCSVLCAPIGVRLAHRLPKKQLERIFAIFLLFVGIKFMHSLL